MKNLKSALNYITHGNVDNDFYTRNKSQLDSHNYNMIKVVTGFSFVMILFLFMLTFFNSILFNLKVFYGLYAIWFFLCALFAFTSLKKQVWLYKPFFIIISCSVLFLCSWIGTVVSKDMYAVTFFVFLMFLPSFYIDKPFNAILIIIISSIIFVIMTILVKTDPTLVKNDTLNAICCSIVAIGNSVYNINVNLKNIEATSILRTQSRFDETTGLPNRRFFNKTINDLFSTPNDKELTLIMMDIDFFKKYNDLYGHQKGDEVLAEIGNKLSKIAKHYDVFVSRYGGEEFVVIDDKHGQNMAPVLAEAFVESISSLKIVHEDSSYGYITLSAGYACSTQQSKENFHHVIELADEALYQAKEQGRNCFIGSFSEK